MLLRYPGAKTRLVKQLLSLFPDPSKVTRYVEPFVGAGSVFAAYSIGMPEGASVLLVDRDPDLVALWRCVQRDPEPLLARCDAFVPSVDVFYDFRACDGSDAPDEDRAFRKVVLHQTSYSGLGAVAGGPIGGSDQKSAYGVGCRWSPKTLRKNFTAMHGALARLDARVECGDFEIALRWASKSDPETTFCYLDPPYYLKGAQCYAHSMAEDDHIRLATSIHKLLCHWRLSYDGAARFFYPTASVVELNAKYSMGAGRVVDVAAIGDTAEVLIAPSGQIDDETSRLRRTTEIAEQTSELIRRGGVLKQVPDMIRELLRDGRYKRRLDVATGDVLVVDRFDELVALSPPRGFGDSVAAWARAIAGTDPSLEAEFWTACGREVGSNQHTEGRDIVTTLKSQRGNSRRRALEVLAREAEKPGAEKRVIDAWRRVEANEVSPHRGMVLAGLRRELTAFDKLCRAWKKATNEERGRFLEWAK